MKDVNFTKSSKFTLKARSFPENYENGKHFVLQDTVRVIFFVRSHGNECESRKDVHVEIQLNQFNLDVCVDVKYLDRILGRSCI